MDPSANDLANRNKAAWGRLYQSTPQLIWGAAPVGFIESFLAPELAAGHRFARALDAAGGEGRNLPVLARLADALTLCDASDAALAKSTPLTRTAVERVRCDLDAMPFADGTFDFVLLCDVVETLPDPLPALREIRRVLAPGGLFACNIPGPEDEVAGVEMTLRWTPLVGQEGREIKI